MKRLIRLFALLICSVTILSGGTIMSVKATNIAPCYNETSDIEVYLNFSQNVAMCDVIIQGKSDTAQITGTITLYDETAGKSVSTRTIYEESAIYTGSFSVNVTAGHKYTLSYSGYVFGQDGSYETVSASVTKEN